MAGIMNSFKGGRMAGAVLGLALAFMGTTLGGCNSVSKEEHAALIQENEELRQENGQITRQKQEADNATAAALAENTRLTQQMAQQPTAQPSGGTWGNETGGGSDRGSSRSTTTRNVGSVNFAPGGTTLDRTMTRKLDSIASSLKGNYSNYDIRIEGHADGAKPTKGKYKSNEELSEARADAVKRYLVQKGISSGRISTSGLGSTTSKVSSDGRRADVIVIGAN
jgi:outer membrane protein OmpA-like peptidoglycan-associated protein